MKGAITNGMTATRLRLILLIAMLLLIVAVIGGFVLIQRSLTGYATAISQLNADAQTGDQSILTLRNLEERLKTDEETIRSAHNIVADSSTYADAVLNDITRIAAQSGVTLTSFEFIDTAAATPATTAPATAPAATPSAPTAAGVTKKAVSVTFESPLNYASLMKFIEGIETNDLKMQIASVAMTKADKGQVGTQAFSIEVYVR